MLSIINSNFKNDISNDKFIIKEFSLFGDEILIDNEINEISIKITNSTDIYTNSIKIENKPNYNKNDDKNDFFKNIKESLRQNYEYEYTTIMTNGGNMQFTIKKIENSKIKRSIIKDFILIKGNDKDFSLFLKSLSIKHNNLIDNNTINERNMNLLLKENNRLRADCNNIFFEKDEILQDLLINMISILNTKKLEIRNLKQKLLNDKNNNDNNSISDEEEISYDTEKVEGEESKKEKKKMKKRKNEKKLEIEVDTNQTIINPPPPISSILLPSNVVGGNNILNHLTQQQTQCFEDTIQDDTQHSKRAKKQTSSTSNSSSSPSSDLSSSQFPIKQIPVSQTPATQTNAPRKKPSCFADSDSDDDISTALS
jgi:hypothetical protein